MQPEWTESVCLPQCGLGSITAFSHLRDEFVVGFSAASPVFFPPEKPTFPNSNSINIIIINCS